MSGNSCATMSKVNYKYLITSESGQNIINETNEYLCAVEDEDGSDKIIFIAKATLVELGVLAERPTDQMEEVVDAETSLDNDASQDSTQNWDDESTRFLLDRYHSYLEKVGPMKRFRNKKMMWCQIANDMQETLKIWKSAAQCENRYKTILKRKTTTMNKNHVSGSSRQAIPFENELDKIKSIDDNVEPEVARGIGRVTYKRSSPLASSSNSSSTSLDAEHSSQSLQENAKPEGNLKRKRKVQSLADVMLQIHTDREKQKQRRHEEKMEIFKKAFGLN